MIAATTNTPRITTTLMTKISRLCLLLEDFHSFQLPCFLTFIIVVFKFLIYTPDADMRFSEAKGFFQKSDFCKPYRR